MSFRVRNSPPTTQGGESGCEIPKYATGALLSLDAINPSGSGYARTWQFATTMPFAVTLLMTNAENNNVVSATVKLPSYTSPADVSLFTTTESDFVVDLTGYTTDCSAYSEYLAFVPTCSFACLPVDVAAAQTGDSMRFASKCFSSIQNHGDAIGCGSFQGLCIPSTPPPAPGSSTPTATSASADCRLLVVPCSAGCYTPTPGTFAWSCFKVLKDAGEVVQCTDDSHRGFCGPVTT